MATRMPSASFWEICIVKNATSSIGPFPFLVKVKMCDERMSSIMVISFGGRVSLIHHVDVFRWPHGYV